jgi:hypothetical protein
MLINLNPKRCNFGGVKIANRVYTRDDLDGMLGDKLFVELAAIFRNGQAGSRSRKYIKSILPQVVSSRPQAKALISACLKKGSDNNGLAMALREKFSIEA